MVFGGRAHENDEKAPYGRAAMIGGVTCSAQAAEGGERQEKGMAEKIEVEIGGRTLSLSTGRVGNQANGAVWVQYGDTVVLVAVVAEKEPDLEKDFFPLQVDYREKSYAAGKIPGGFFKREVGERREKQLPLLVGCPFSLYLHAIPVLSLPKDALCLPKSAIQNSKLGFRPKGGNPQNKSAIFSPYPIPFAFYIFG